MKKNLIIFLLVLSVFAVSCGKKGEATSTGKIEPLEYWTFFSGGDGEFMTELVNKHNEQNPENPVKPIIIDWGTYYTKLSTAYLGGELPDIGTAHQHMLSSILTFGDLIPIDSIEPNFDWSQYPNITVDNITIDGSPLAVPFDTHGFVMYYNTDLVSGTSLVDADGNWIADTWEQFEIGLGEVKAKYPDVYPLTMNNPDTAFQWVWYSLYNQLGGKKLITEDGLLEVDIEPAKKALDALKSVYDKGYSPKGHMSSLDFMKEGKAAVAFEGVWVAGALRQTLPNVKAITMPAFFGKDVAWGTGHVLIIPQGKNIDEAKQKRAVAFAQWMVENGALWANAGHVPASSVVQNSEEYKSNPNSVFQPLAVNVVAWPKSKYLDIAIAGQLSPLANSLDQYLNGSVATVEEMIEKANEEISYKK